MVHCGIDDSRKPVAKHKLLTTDCNRVTQPPQMLSGGTPRRCTSQRHSCRMPRSPALGACAAACCLRQCCWAMAFARQPRHRSIPSSPVSTRASINGQNVRSPRRWPTRKPMPPRAPHSPTSASACAASCSISRWMKMRSRRSCARRFLTWTMPSLRAGRRMACLNRKQSMAACCTSTARRRTCSA